MLFRKSKIHVYEKFTCSFKKPMQISGHVTPSRNQEVQNKE